MTDTYILVLLFILGSVMGSFYACMGYRIPNKIKLTYPSSFCDHCKKPLKWYMNIPIFSYIFLKGKCAYCKKKINPLGLLIEILTALLFMVSYIVFGFTIKFFLAIILISALSVTIISDFVYYYISDRVIIISLIAVLIANLCFYGISTIYIPIINGLIGFLLMYAIKLFGDLVFKRESLGGGDIKLMALIGSIFNFIQLTLSMGLAAVLGLIFAIFASSDDKTGIVPFGPFLLIGALIILFFNINIIL